MDGEGQESLGLVEDVENREGHKGLLGVHGVLLGHQSMDSKYNQCHLGETGATGGDNQRLMAREGRPPAGLQGPRGHTCHVGMGSLPPRSSPKFCW